MAGGSDKSSKARRKRLRRRKAAALTGTALLVAAAVAGEPLQWSGAAAQAAGGVGHGLGGLVDPGSVGADGRSADGDGLSDETLRNAGNIGKLLELGPIDSVPTGPLGIPGVMLEAYMDAAKRLATTQPDCNLHWSLLASIGRIESNHARGGQVNAVGDTVPRIYGPVLNGGGFAAIRDTDDGALDEDSRWDRAVGAMQFIPSTWQGYASDGNGDGRSDPHNVYDQTVAAGKYLCSGGLDMDKPRERATAVFRYNHSDSYVRTVLIWADAYAKGVQPLPSADAPTGSDDPVVAAPPRSGPIPSTPNRPSTTPSKDPAPGTKTTTRTTTKTTTTTRTTITTTITTTSRPCDPDEPTTTTTTTTTTTATKKKDGATSPDGSGEPTTTTTVTSTTDAQPTTTSATPSTSEPTTSTTETSTTPCDN